MRTFTLILSENTLNELKKLKRLTRVKIATNPFYKHIEIRLIMNLILLNDISDVNHIHFDSYYRIAIMLSHKLIKYLIVLSFYHVSNCWVRYLIKFSPNMIDRLARNFDFNLIELMTCFRLTYLIGLKIINRFTKQII